MKNCVILDTKCDPLREFSQPALRYRAVHSETRAVGMIFADKSGAWRHTVRHLSRKKVENSPFCFTEYLNRLYHESARFFVMIRNER